MKNEKEKQNLNKANCNDSEYQALLKSEGEKINKAKYDFQAPSPGFQSALKSKILEERQRKSFNMKKIFEILTLPLQPRYSVSVIALALVLFAGLSFVSFSQKEGSVADNLVFVVTKKIPQGIVDNISKVIEPKPEKKKIDDWQYAFKTEEEGLVQKIFSPLSGARQSSVSAPMMLESTDSIGFSTGGAKDINNFRVNIENDYLPLPTDITYEGLFYDYYFDTGQAERCDKLFCPSYSYAVSSDPFSEKDEYYLAVGLNSGIKESDFERKKLNLVVVLDISGSMSSPFNKYYYDQFGNKIEVEGADIGKSKMAIAAESVNALIDHLNDDDRFGMVLFNSNAYLAKPLNLVGETDMEKIKDHILEIQATGGTYMEAGMKTGTELFDEILDVDQSEYENRIIFLTDAMPNIGAISQDGLLGITERNSKNKLYSTFIGIGVDFNTELIEHITKIRGANYYSVHSSKEFKKRMGDEFEYMVTPLVFNLLLTLEAEGYKIEKVYGSPEADEATGELMKVNTLFPSSRKEGETRGGLVLLKLKKTSSEASLKLKVSYEDRAGKSDSSQTGVEISKGAEYFENIGIRKGIILARYANLIKNWINDERANYQKPEPFMPCITEEIGIIEPCPIQLGKWERQSIPLMVSSHYKDLFKEFKPYFEREMNAIGDNTLKQEIEILSKLLNY